MALSQSTHVYMEAMEVPKDEVEKFNETGNTRVLCANGGKQSERSLVLCKLNNSETSHDKRKTDKQWLL